MATRKIYNEIDAMASLYPGGNWSWSDGFEDAYDGLNWMDEVNPKPSKQEIQTEVDRLQAEYNAEFYKLERAAAYPSITDQLDMQYWDAINATNNWQELIESIKAQYPKP